MGQEPEYEAKLVVQQWGEDGLGKEYLIQVDTKDGRIFVDINQVILAVQDGGVGKGEYYLSGNKEPVFE